MKVALANDSHWSVKNDSELMSQMISDFYTEQFFPYMEENGITHIIHLGDIFDRRKFINFNTLSYFHRNFFDVLIERKYTMDLILGNHDIYWKNTNELNGPEEILKHYDGLKIYKQAEEVFLDGRKILYIPWICKDNYDHTMNIINKTDASYAMGHLELGGFEMLAGIKAEEGMTSTIYNKFNRVMSGHYHHKSDNGVIFYLGTQYELTWADYNDPKGFHVFDTDTGELEFIQNPNRLFHKVIYNDETHDYKKFNVSQFRNKYVKLIVEKKKNTIQFEKLIDKLYTAELADLQIIEDSFFDENMNNVLDTQENYEDTLTLVSSYVKTVTNDEKVEKDLGLLLKTLYLESVAE